MIISEEQVRLAAEYLQTHKTEDGMGHVEIADQTAAEIVERVRRALAETPDVRDDRIAEARELLAGAMPGTDVVASKLIGRVISDALR